MIIVKIKKCSRCKTDYPATKDFFYGNSGTSDGLASNCKICSGKATRRWANSNPDKVREYARRSNLKKKGINKEIYEKMAIQQEWKCLICGITERECKKKLSVDHNHKTGKVRGLICNRCNLALGNTKDNPLILIKCAKYLLSYD